MNIENMIKFNCDYCRKINYQPWYQYKFNKHHFCNQKCHYNFVKIIKKCYCVDCGELLGRRAYYYKNKRCISCANKYRLKNLKNHTAYKDGRTLKKYYCIDCQIQLKSYKSKRCQSCAAKKRFENIKNHPCYKERIKVKCNNCGKDILITQKEFKRNKHYFCKNDHLCYYEWLSKNLIGKKSNLYIHGNGYKIYPKKFNERFKDMIRKRDGYKCQYPGCKMTQEKHLKLWKQKLNVHHTDYDKNHTEPLRSITLCRKHNMKVNRDRDYWFAYFSYIIEEYYKKERKLS